MIMWPTMQGCAIIKNQFPVNHGFQFFFGVIDGALLFLSERPKIDGCIFNARKVGYTMNILIMCDNTNMVTNMRSGWCGSTHDNNVWRNNHFICTRQ